MTDTLRNMARNAARRAYLNDPYGHGPRDWQSAEVAAYEVLIARGISEEEATDEGRLIGSEAVDLIENAEARP